MYKKKYKDVNEKVVAKFTMRGASRKAGRRYFISWIKREKENKAYVANVNDHYFKADIWVLMLFSAAFWMLSWLFKIV